MAKADKYGTADSAMRIKINVTEKPVQPSAMTRPAGDNPSQQDNKRKFGQPDLRHGSKQVATVEEGEPASQAGSQRQRIGKAAWQPKLTFEKMLDAPYKMDTGAKLATHTLR
ncbi:hypothetical protein D1007_57232 [Hordeum vulgare]|nr:hypothetical protein D1007_57232 [Hordeum vulgare]